VPGAGLDKVVGHAGNNPNAIDGNRQNPIAIDCSRPQSIAIEIKNIQ